MMSGGALGTAMGPRHRLAEMRPDRQSLGGKRLGDSQTGADREFHQLKAATASSADISRAMQRFFDVAFIVPMRDVMR
jgi:hypothetical protein